MKRSRDHPGHDRLAHWSRREAWVVPELYSYFHTALVRFGFRLYQDTVSDEVVECVEQDGELFRLLPGGRLEVASRSRFVGPLEYSQFVALVSPYVDSDQT